MTKTKTLYNAECPVCNFEISHYARYADARALPLDFEDLNTVDLTRWGVTKDAAMRRLYVLHDAQMYSGIPAFLILWRQMPRYRIVAKIVGLPVIKQISVAIYNYILAPIIYHWAKRRNAKAARNA